MKTSKKILASVMLASVMTLSLALSASAENSKSDYNDEEEIVVSVTSSTHEEAMDYIRSRTETHAVMVFEDKDNAKLSTTSIEPRAYSWYNYTGDGTTAWTDGGSGGSIPILARVYERKYELYGSACQRYCGVEANIDYDKIANRGNLKTNITIKGELLRDGEEPVLINASGNTDLLRAEKMYSSTSDYSNCFQFCKSTITTESEAFGYSTQSCNFSVVPFSN